MSTSILVVDDHKLVRLGLISLFESDERFRIVGEAATVAGAVEAAAIHQPDVVILDLRLPDGSGIEACREIRSQRPETRVIILTSYADEDAVIASILAGASGYLLKRSNPEQVVDAVVAAVRDGSLLDESVASSVISWIRRVAAEGGDDPLAKLTEQERHILPLIAEGKTNRQIASELYLSNHTVKTYISNILKKLDLTRRAEAAAFITRQRSRSLE